MRSYFFWIRLVTISNFIDQSSEYNLVLEEKRDSNPFSNYYLGTLYPLTNYACILNFMLNIESLIYFQSLYGQ